MLGTSAISRREGKREIGARVVCLGVFREEEKKRGGSPL